MGSMLYNYMGAILVLFKFQVQWKCCGMVQWTNGGRYAASRPCRARRRDILQGDHQEQICASTEILRPIFAQICRRCRSSQPRDVEDPQPDGHWWGEDAFRQPAAQGARDTNWCYALILGEEYMVVRKWKCNFWMFLFISFWICPRLTTLSCNQSSRRKTLS